ncbi:transketolase [Salisediminibacterium halotolerans]|uniref:Transketolase n=1 Tax=Salisediminibacterium halotolerans TaxID=517425 RepID=A0A1H9W6A4_9BACI|nr:transketolase [Salisediminibacterium haloalkalitolerans]SES29301.1 transketolase [Salisediminibacterium haloalkalitolerans]
MSVQLDDLAVNTVRTLSIDAVEKAASGHPGLPMGAAPIGYKVFTEFMKHNPENPQWFNRDRFVLSAGHGSMLLYSLLHLSGYDVTLDDLKAFRQWGSRTPGHPEFGHTPGVEATTGPLGQGLAMCVGMAMAEKHLAGKYNTEDFNIIDHYTYGLCSDGDLMEGVAAEASSLAGHLQLGKLILLYDSNDVSLDGELNQAFSENVLKRYEAYGWHVEYVEDGNDLEAIGKAIENAKNDERPSMIEVRTVIGYGSPNKSGSSASHGAPLGEDEVKLAKEYYKWESDEAFHIPDRVREHFAELKKQGSANENAWNEQFARYKEAHPELAAELEQAINGELPADWADNLPVYEEGDKEATRATGGEAVNALSKSVPSLFGGSADLSVSNKTMIKNEQDFAANNAAGRNIWFGVREFAMAAAGNGMMLHGGLRPYVSTFFVFSDYLRPALRLSALMGAPVTYVFTHDSIAVGEDGPTHEPIEHLASLRAIPNLSLIRPADGNETVAAWKVAQENRQQPTALVLTRQGLPTLPGTKDAAYEGVRRGAYTVSEASGQVDGLLLATGSEVSLAVEAQKELEKDGIHVSVVSMPSWDRFEAQSADYKEQVLPKSVKTRLAVEVGAPLGWERYTGDQGSVLGINGFGASAPGDRIMKEYGFTAENVAAQFKQLIEK